MWIDPIFDRTEEDVAYAIANQDQTTEMKGALDYRGLNRIEDNIDFLCDLLNDYHYYCTITPKSSVWTYSDYLSLEDFNRIIDNTMSIKQAFFNISYLPTLYPFSVYRGVDFQTINDIEYILDEVYNRLITSTNGAPRLAINLGRKKL